MSAEGKTGARTPSPTPGTAPGTAPSTTEEPRFEEMLERLRTTVERLESGQLSLDDSLRVFEEGVRLHRDCAERLDAADRRIERLLEQASSGVPRTAPFEPPREE